MAIQNNDTFRRNVELLSSTSHKLFYCKKRSVDIEKSRLMFYNKMYRRQKTTKRRAAVKKFKELFSLKRFASFTVKYRWIMIAVFVVLSVASAVIMPFTKIVYDVSSYLPDDSTSAIGLSVLKEEFDDKGMTYAVVSDVSADEAQEIARKIARVEGVAATIFEASTSYNEETRSALIAISLSDYDSTQGCFDTMERLTKTGKEYDAVFVGQSASSYYTKLETERSILKIGVVIVVIILIMLLVTSKSYFELLPMLLNFGVSVLLNMGTNFLFNGISYISNLVSLVLQLALSIDYSVILMHRYMEERENGLSGIEAAVEAQRKGIPEILSSSLTTIAGLGALMFMTLDIGVEIGLALAKGIVFSLFSVIFLMPALLVLFDKPLTKTKHRSFLPNVTKPTKFILKGRKVIVPVFLILVILSGVGQSFNTYSFNMNGGAEIVEGQEKTKEAGFGTMNTLVIILPNDGNADKQREVIDYVTSFDVVDSSTALANQKLPGTDIYLTDRIGKDDIQGIVSSFSGIPNLDFSKIYTEYCEAHGLNAETDEVMVIDLLLYLPENKSMNKMLSLMGEEYLSMLDNLAYAKNNLMGENYVRMTFNIDSSVEDVKAFELIEELKRGLPNYYDEFYMTGETVVCYDMSLYFPQDNRNINLFTLAFILLILFVTFKNFLLPFLLALAIQGGIWINFVIPFLGNYPLCFIGYLIITAVQMGATIDYAIVLTNRYYSIRKEGVDRLQTMAEAMNAVFPTIINSGIILMVTGFTLALASSGVVAAMGSLLGIGTALSVGIVLFILPSLLLVTEKVTDICDFKNVFKRRKNK